jgi:hypothetical protein
MPPSKCVDNQRLAYRWTGLEIPGIDMQTMAFYQPLGSRLGQSCPVDLMARDIEALQQFHHRSGALSPTIVTEQGVRRPFGDSPDSPRFLRTFTGHSQRLELLLVSPSSQHHFQSPSASASGQLAWLLAIAQRSRVVSKTPGTLAVPRSG